MSIFLEATNSSQIEELFLFRNALRVGQEKTDAGAETTAGWGRRAKYQGLLFVCFSLPPLFVCFLGTPMQRWRGKKHQGTKVNHTEEISRRC